MTPQHKGQQPESAKKGCKSCAKQLKKICALEEKMAALSRSKADAISLNTLLKKAVADQSKQSYNDLTTRGEQEVLALKQQVLMLQEELLRSFEEVSECENDNLHTLQTYRHKLFTYLHTGIHSFVRNTNNTALFFPNNVVSDNRN